MEIKLDATIFSITTAIPYSKTLLVLFLCQNAPNLNIAQLHTCQETRTEYKLLLFLVELLPSSHLPICKLQNQPLFRIKLNQSKNKPLSRPMKKFQLLMTTMVQKIVEAYEADGNGHQA